jgi:hypothetical protein
MEMSTRHWSLTTWVLSCGRRRAASCLAGLAVAAICLPGAAMSAVAVTPPTLVVVILGAGGVTSQPAGIICPGRCTAAFVAGTSVLLTPKSKNGSTFLRWGGSCTGAGACTVKVSALTAVAAQFVGGQHTPPASAPKYVAVPGPYSGQNGQNGNGISFYVAPGGRSMVNILDTATGLDCKPSGGTTDHLGILEVAIQPNGSFSLTTSQNAINGEKFTYKIEGRFQAATATAAASAAGTWREDIAFARGTVTSCTSNDQSWTATLYREPAQQKALVTPGSYSGSNGQNGNGITFSVAPGGKSMLNISDTATGLDCTPAGGATDHLSVPQVAVMPDGSFNSTTSQDGVLNGVNAKFTYTFAGYFEGRTPPSGAPTVAGIWREDIVFASGTTTMCTSNDQS